MPQYQVIALKLASIERTMRTLGHDAGRSELRVFADKLRAMDLPFIAKGGRDIFLIFGEKRDIGNKLRSLSSPRDTLIININRTSHFFAGAASWPRHGETADVLLRRAEAALSVAVQKRQRWVDYRASMEPNQDDLRLVSLFEETAGTGLHPVFQPQIDLRTGTIVGAEALARWDAEGIGPVSPGRFIPLLEDAGFIGHVTHRMIRDAVRVAAALRKEGLVCPISVNVSVSDLLSGKLKNRLFKALRIYGGMPSDIRLELTETGMTDRPDTVAWAIEKLRNHGISTSIDDFGTGYSSLAYLSEFPVDEVKIDRSFVNGMINRPRDASIVRSTIAMAHELGLLAVAEGIETEPELIMLRELGCDRAQGYLVSKPLHERDFLRFLQMSDADAGKTRPSGAPRGRNLRPA